MAKLPYKDTNNKLRDFVRYSWDLSLRIQAISYKIKREVI